MPEFKCDILSHFQTMWNAKKWSTFTCFYLSFPFISTEVPLALTDRKLFFFFVWLVHNRGVNICLARHCYQRSSSHLRTKQISGTTSRETVPNNRVTLQSYTKFSKSGFKWMHSSGQQTLEGFNFSTKVNTDSSWCQNKPSGSKITVDYLPKNLYHLHKIGSLLYYLLRRLLKFLTFRQSIRCFAFVNFWHERGLI